MSEYGPEKSNTYAIILVHADGRQVTFESGLSKKRADEMGAILRGFIRDFRVIDESLPGLT